MPEEIEALGQGSLVLGSHFWMVLQVPEGGKHVKNLCTMLTCDVSMSSAGLDRFTENKFLTELSWKLGM